MQQELIILNKKEECWESRNKIYVQHDECGQIFWFKNYCNSILCKTCQERKSKSITKKLVNLFSQKPEDMFFMTLTFKQTKTLEQKDIKKFSKQFKKFRDNYITKGEREIEKGFYVFEYKYNNKTKLWHNHVHILYEGKRIGIERLSKLWKISTNNEAYIVDIRRKVQGLYGQEYYLKDSPSKAISYLAKYLYKIPVLPDTQKKQYITALKGVRRFNTIGTKKKTKTNQIKTCPACNKEITKFTKIDPKHYNVEDAKSFSEYKIKLIEIKLTKDYQEIILEQKEYSGTELENLGINIQKALREGDIYETKPDRYRRI